MKSKASKTSPKRASSNVKGRCGPSFSLPHPPAKVSSLNTKQPLSLGGANWSSCPLGDPRRQFGNWLSWVALRSGPPAPSRRRSNWDEHQSRWCSSRR